MRTLKKVLPTEAINAHLNKVSGLAISNNRYRWGINTFERYRRQYLFNKRQKYRLALMYDHLAMMNYDKIRKQKRNVYLKKAKNLYREILKEDPNFFHATFGIGRIYKIQGDYRKALRFQILAYKKMLKLPRSQRGALAIGAIYERLGNNKKAETWYLREYRDTPRNDFGSVLNLFNFYKRSGKWKEARKYGMRTEKLLKQEYKKKVYKGLRMQNSKFLRHIRAEIREIKKSAARPQISQLYSLIRANR